MADTANDNSQLAVSDSATLDTTAALHLPVCPACGASARRGDASFCTTCGRSLANDEYLPTDALRSSYHYQRTRPPTGQLESPHITSPSSPARFTRVEKSRADVNVSAAGHYEARFRAPARNRAASRGVAYRRRTRLEDSLMPFVTNTNGASTTALALVTYALVPYLGILFCPGAVLMGGIGLLRASRAPYLGGRRASAVSIVLGLVIFCVQLFLWWILYKVPEWSHQF